MEVKAKGIEVFCLFRVEGGCGVVSGGVVVGVQAEGIEVLSCEVCVLSGRCIVSGRVVVGVMAKRIEVFSREVCIEGGCIIDSG